MHQVATPAVPNVAIPPRDWSKTAFNWLVWGGLVGVLAWGFEPAEIYRAVNLFTDADNMAEYAAASSARISATSTTMSPKSS